MQPSVLDAAAKPIQWKTPRAPEKRNVDVDAKQKPKVRPKQVKVQSGVWYAIMLDRDPRRDVAPSK